MNTLIYLTCFFVLGLFTWAAEPMVVAHRGASGEAPENTIPAFELAWKQGADAIEGDFHLTKDGKVVCIHDGNTQKVAGENLVVRNSTLDELKKLDVGLKKGAAFEGTFIPTIAEVFDTIPAKKKIYIEIKCGLEIVIPVLQAVAQSGLKNEQIVFICFNVSVIQAVKARAPQFAAYWLCSVKRNEAGAMTPSLEKALATLQKAKADGMSSSKSGITDEYISGLQRAGFEHHVWTVNEAKTAQWFVDRGSKSVTTDFPGKIKGALKARVTN
ncbi:MAG: glycerophosphodiester phosphodiesterase [Akkermansiaceae bacterium]